MKLFKMDKKCKDKEFNLTQWVKRLKNRVGQHFIFHTVIPVHFFSGFFLVVLKSLHFSMPESKLWHSKTKTKNVGFIKTCDQYQHKLILMIFSAHKFLALPFLSGKKYQDFQKKKLPGGNV